MKIHCDDVIHDHDYPECLRYFILVHRLPAADSMLILSYEGYPECWATYKGERVRLTHASRGGHVSIDGDGFTKSVCISELSDFTDAGKTY